MATFLITACSNENDEELISTSTTGILSATVEGNHSSTRAGFASDGKFYWSQNDRLGVTTSQNASSFSALSLKNGSGTASGTFDGTINGTIGDYAVYPYYDNHNINDATLTYNFPTSYTYNKVDADYFTTVQGEGNSFNPAMWGKIVNGAVQMKHLGGVFCIKVPKMPIKAGILSLIVDKKITGNFTVDLNGEIPVIESTETSTNENNTVTITFSDATQDQPGVFYVPVPTGTYDVRIKVTENQSSPEKVNVAAGTYTIARCDLKKIELTNGNIDATVPTESNSLDDAATALENSDAVTVTGEVSSNSSISIPAASDGTAETAKSLSLEKVASGACLTVLDANSSGSTDNSVDNFTLSIPINETAKFEPLDVTITMPNTTVALTGNAGAAIYGTVTSETADNTLVIGNGVEVKKVVVKKGNIRVNKGAKLVAIEKSSDNQATTVTVYKEDGAEIPSSLDGVFVVVDAAVADMKKVLADGGIYTLSNDMEGDFVVSATTPVTVKLNGHKITNKASDTFTVNHGSSLTIEGEGIVDNVTHARACIYNNGKVLLNGGTYTRSLENGQSDTNAGGNSYYNILNHGEMTINQSVSVSQSGKFSSMIASGYYDYSNTNPRNGHVEGTNAAAPKLTINGGTFSGGLNTIKNDDGATLEIKNGTFNNMSQATVQNHHVTTISGGTFNCSGAKYAVDNEGHNDAKQDMGDMTISGGIFSGLMLNVGNGADMTIIGGTFSDPGILQYLPKEGTANVKVALESDMTAPGFVTQDGQMVEIDMNRHTLTFGNPTVGSPGTETNSCQLLKGSTVTFKNGTLISDNKDIVIQNYSKLHLEDMMLNTPNADYSISNNNESCTLDNVTINAGTGKCAFDVYSFSGYDGVTVTVNSGTINGNVEFGGNNPKKNIKLIVNGGTFNGNLTVNEQYYDFNNPNIIISKEAVIGEYAIGWDKYIK